MFVGHYGVSLAAKGADRRIPLWVLFIATQWVDVLWGPLVAAGVEKVRIVEGFTEVNALDLYYMPYTHSLTAAVAWSLIVAGGYLWIGKWRGWGGSAILVGAVVLSHWLVDLPMHVPDLPLYGNVHKVGFGLWNNLSVSLLLEALLLFGGLWHYLRRTRAAMPGGRYAMILFCLAMFGIHLIGIFGPPPAGPAMAGITALVLYLLFAGVAAWLDPKRD